MRKLLRSLPLVLMLTSISFAQSYVGYDRNQYPGDAMLPRLHQHFAFTGYWLNNPPGGHSNGWKGKRSLLLKQGFGFLVLFNGRLDQQIKAAHMTPKILGKQDAGYALAAAQREHFPLGTTIFLDQEEGGRLLPEQADYLFAWTEAVTGSGYKAGVYVSGQAVEDSPGKTITTVQDIRQHIAAQHLHDIAIFVYQDACPPAPGCVLHPPALNASGTPNIVVWQYAQSPRRPEITGSCAKTYAADGNCYAGDLKGLILDLDVAGNSDPSHGR